MRKQIRIIWIQKKSLKRVKIVRNLKTPLLGDHSFMQPNFATTIFNIRLS